MNKISKCLCALVLCAVTVVLVAYLLPTQVRAAREGYYTYSVSGGEAEITDCDSSISGAVTIPATLGGYPVTSIGGYAFRWCDSLTSVTIPNSVTSIGEYAFSRCEGLASVTIGNSVTSIGDSAFYWCYSLTSVTIGNSVTSIGGYAFYYCDSLTSVTIPNSVTSIGDSAFRICSSLTGIWVDKNNPNYCSDESGVLFNKNKTELIQAPGGISGTYTIPDSVTSIGEYAFYGCDSLTSVTIGNSVTSIGSDAFTLCDSLTSVTIGNSVTSIGSNAFYWCSSLTSVTIGNSVTSIGSDAFMLCDSLTSVTIPDSVTSIGELAFSFCDSLTSITIPDSVTSIGDSAFGYCSSLKGIWVDKNNPNYSSDESGVLFNKNKTQLIQAPGGISGIYTIPDGVTSFGDSSFRCCSSLTSVTIPNSVTSIGNRAFYNCDSLTCAIVPAEAEIASDAFAGCPNLTLKRKYTVSKLAAPAVSSKTATSVTLVKVTGAEYSKDGNIWQSSNVFVGLSANTQYRFYQRLVETETTYAGEASEPLSVTTLKYTVAAPGKPVAEQITQTTVTLAAYTEYEYSLDGTTWQSSNRFTGLVSDTTYTFYQRVAENEATAASKKSEAIVVTTLPKADCLNKAEKPILIHAGNNSISLLALDGYEYRIGSGQWQATPVFDYLKWGETYTLYQRIKETSTHKASASSEGLVVDLNMKPSVTFCQSMLSDYIDIYGTTLSNGNKRVTKMADSTYIYLENTPQGIYCGTYDSASKSSITTKYYFGFYLNPTSKYVKPTLKIELYYGKNLMETTELTAMVDRTTYTLDTIIHLDGHADGSNGHELYNSNLKLLCAATHIILTTELSCGIGGVGFLEFSGEDDGAFYCDPALNHQLGSKVLKYGYAATCERQGYTGDYCCSYCGEIIERGRAISTLGGHEYTNSCDTECNQCESVRDIEHTYSNSCDTNCNVCNAKRKAIHTYNNVCDNTCNECAAVRKPSHIYDDKKDLICNGCGYERPPYVLGDVDENDEVDIDDVVTLLLHVSMPDMFDIEAEADFDGNGEVDIDDVVTLLLHVSMPDMFPLELGKKEELI